MSKKQERYLEFKNISKDIIDWFEYIAEENNCHVEKKEWKSKYNNYVIYDYEPFCSDGFEINVVISSYDYNYLDFIKYLYEEYNIQAMIENPDEFEKNKIIVNRIRRASLYIT